jgi:hypothetical protein
LGGHAALLVVHHADYGFHGDGAEPRHDFLHATHDHVGPVTAEPREKKGGRHRLRGDQRQHGRIVAEGVRVYITGVTPFRHRLVFK